MNIKKTLTTYLQKRYNNDNSEYSIRVMVRWKKEDGATHESVAFNIGHSILQKKWDSSSSRVKKNAINSKMLSAHEINRDIQHIQDIIH